MADGSFENYVSHMCHVLHLVVALQEEEGVFDRVKSLSPGSRVLLVAYGHGRDAVTGKDPLVAVVVAAAEEGEVLPILAH